MNVDNGCKIAVVMLVKITVEISSSGGGMVVVVIVKEVVSAHDNGSLLKCYRNGCGDGSDQCHNFDKGICGVGKR